LLFGVAGIAMARTFSGARTYLIGGGVIYSVLFIYGMVVDQHTAANFVPVNGGQLAAPGVGDRHDRTRRPAIPRQLRRPRFRWTPGLRPDPDDARAPD
jgi:hypothetical protein